MTAIDFCGALSPSARADLPRERGEISVASRVDELAKQGGGGKGSSLDPKWMQGLEQNLAQVRRVVEEIAMRPASAGSTTSSSGSASSSYESQSGSTSNATSASTSTSTPEPAAAAGDGEGPGGKKVMSAIERLKKLRGN